MEKRGKEIRWKRGPTKMSQGFARWFLVSGRVLKMVTEMGSATIGGISPALSANAAKSFLEATDKEKKELQVRPVLGRRWWSG